ncbi:hypothetical protein C8Q74DRAFT_513157 [Fomes fomentarius]|nr:hypothetical protein C8Q74DRAFT_513157 [Fomes fomentarius]
MEHHGLTRPAIVNSELHGVFPEDLVVRKNGTIQWDVNNWTLSVLPAFLELNDNKVLSLHDVDMKSLQDLLKQSSPNIDTIKDAWSFRVQHTEHSCRHPWPLPMVPSVGLCFPGSHSVCIAPYRYHPATIDWKLVGPRHFRCLCEARDNWYSPLCRNVACKRRAIFVDPLEVADELYTDLPNATELNGTISQGTNGWRRHSVGKSTPPTLLFHLYLSGCPWREVRGWFCDKVLSDDIPAEAASGMGIGT